MREKLLIRSVHLDKVGHIRQEDLYMLTLHPTNITCACSCTTQPRYRGKGGKTHINFNNLLHARLRRVKDGLDIIATGLGPVADGAADEVCGSVGGDLARDEDLAIGTDGLGLFV